MRAGLHFFVNVSCILVGDQWLIGSTVGQPFHTRSKSRFNSDISYSVRTGVSSNGRTGGFESPNGGSIPSTPTAVTWEVPRLATGSGLHPAAGGFDPLTSYSRSFVQIDEASTHRISWCLWMGQSFGAGRSSANQIRLQARHSHGQQ